MHCSSRYATGNGRYIAWVVTWKMTLFRWMCYWNGGYTGPLDCWFTRGEYTGPMYCPLFTRGEYTGPMDCSLFTRGGYTGPMNCPLFTGGGYTGPTDCPLFTGGGEGYTDVLDGLSLVSWRECWFGGCISGNMEGTCDSVDVLLLIFMLGSYDRHTLVCR